MWLLGISLLLGAGSSAAAAPLLLLTDTAALASLERQGFDLKSEMQATCGPCFTDLVRAVDKSLKTMQREFLASAMAQRSAAAFFPIEWLTSKAAAFRLVGLVNRLDLTHADGTPAGELRLVYRLSYKLDAGGHQQAGDLPMTVNLRFPYQSGDASHWRAVAQSWETPQAMDATWLKARPLRPSRLRDGGKFSAVELNLQAARWGGDSRGAMGGQADYLMLALAPNASSHRLDLVPLTNVPDFARLRRDTALRARFLAWLRSAQTLRAADAGRSELPPAFAASRAISVSPHGLQRLANQPYASLVDPVALRSVDFSKTKNLTSDVAYLRWLDETTCSGCHQSRSVGGFHLWGETAPRPDEAQAARSFSPFVRDELKRRERAVDSLQRTGSAPTELNFPEHEDAEPGAVGATCGLPSPAKPGESPIFARWTCAVGLRCASDNTLLNSPIGTCVDILPGELGGTCQAGRITRVFNRYADKMRRNVRVECRDGAGCSPPEAGIPAGLCTRTCDLGTKADTAGVVCIPLPLLAAPSCGAATDPDRCRAALSVPSFVRRCSSDAVCSNDQVCVASPTGLLGCVPVYAVKGFAFDMNPWPP